MAEELTFMMGKYAARLPGELRYCRNHMWCRPLDNGRLRFGFTTYAVRLMQDVYFLDWSVNASDAVTQGQQVGHIETSKAVSDLFAPLSGTVAAFNQELLNDPSGINVDNHGAGWLFEMDADISGTMTAEEYHQFLDANWEKTQRTLKGHM
jgi:glycine cleavage system H protein